MTKVCIIGAGPAGCFASILIKKFHNYDVMIFDVLSPLHTLLPTGGGRCNLSYDENDITELTKNYPRGNKFLLSVFNQFAPKDAIDFFKTIKIDTYIQNDKRIFPVSNSAKDVANKLLLQMKKQGIIVKKEKVINLSKNNDSFKVITDKDSYIFDKVIISTGGKGNGFELAKSFNHSISDLKPSLCSLEIEEDEFYKLAGISLKNVVITVESNINKKKYKISGDILFTHHSLSGPLIFKITANEAFTVFNEVYPLKLNINFNSNLTENDFLHFLSNNSKKNIKNVVSEFIPEKLSALLIKYADIDQSKQSAHLSSEEKHKIFNLLTNCPVNGIKRHSGSEIVTAGGINLNEINSKDMQSKLVKNLYFSGEILDIDGYTGGFNLQNCWSTSFVCARNM